MPKAANVSTAPTIWCFRLAETFSLQTLLLGFKVQGPEARDACTAVYTTCLCEALSQVDEGVHTPGGSSVIPEARLLDSGISMPNGLAFSPDEKVLYIANSGPTPEILAFDVTWHDERTKKSSKTGRAAKTQRSSGKKSETKRQSLDELLQELDEDDEDAGKVAMEGETVDAHAEPTEGTETQTSGASVP